MSEASTSPPHASPTTAPRGKLVMSLIVLSLFLFVVMFALLYHQWVAYREPEFEVIIVGTHYFDGAIITVESVNPERKLTATMGDLGRTEVPFFLPAGHYMLSAQFKGGVIGPIDFSLSPNGPKFSRFELLTNESATTRPTLPNSNLAP